MSEVRPLTYKEKAFLPYSALNYVNVKFNFLKEL